MASKNARPVTKQVVETTTVVVPTTSAPIEKTTSVKNKNRNPNTRHPPKTKAPKTTKEITVIVETEEDSDIEAANDEAKKTSRQHHDNQQEHKTKNGHKIPKNIVTGGSTTQTPQASVSKKCSFNPCKNDGACVLLDRDRFKCICKPFFYGVYCEYRELSQFLHSLALCL